MAKNKKLSDVQTWVVVLMSSNWELVRQNNRTLNASTPLADRYILQRGGHGKGGQVATVRYNTIASLMSMGIISTTDGKKYHLTYATKK